MISVNERAYSIFEDLKEFAEDYCVEVHTLENGAVVIDCGVKAKGSYDAGMMFVQMAMGGLAGVNVQMDKIGDFTIPFIYVHTDYPALSCLGCQMAGWMIKTDDFSGFASGPARALALKPKKLFDYLDYEDDTEYAVVTLESNKLPDERVAEFIAKACDVDVSEVYMVVTSSNSLVGTIQIAGRVVEVALFRARDLGYDVRLISNAIGRCPIPPVLDEELKTMSLANDCIAYYGSVYIYAERFDEILESATFDKTAYYGKSFYEIFKSAGDLYNVDPSAFSPAQLVVNAGGVVKSFGRLDAGILLKSFGLV